MRYFDGITTEKKLQEEYRRLLIRSDYRNSKNASLVAEIKKCYEDKLLEIKRANGYRTMKDKIATGILEGVDMLIEYRDEQEILQEKERQRVAALRNHNYTNQELESYVAGVKRCLDIIIKNIVREQKRPYEILSNSCLKFDEVTIFRWFSLHILNMAGEEAGEEYFLLKEKMEYAVKNIARRTGKSAEKYLTAFEKSLGAYMIKKIHDYENQYVDPIILADKEVSVRKEVKSDTFVTKLIWLGNSCAIGSLLLVFLYFILGGTSISLGIAIVITIIFTILLYKKMIKWAIKANKKTIGTSGYNGKRKGRYSE